MSLYKCPECGNTITGHVECCPNCGLPSSYLVPIASTVPEPEPTPVTIVVPAPEPEPAPVPAPEPEPTPETIVVPAPEPVLEPAPEFDPATTLFKCPECGNIVLGHVKYCPKCGSSGNELIPLIS